MVDAYPERVVHVLTEDLPAARKCLNQAGFRIVQETQVALVPVSDEPGAAARVFQRIADAHINVRYTYLATRNRLVIAADTPQAILDAPAILAPWTVAVWVAFVSLQERGRRAPTLGRVHARDAPRDLDHVVVQVGGIDRGF